MIDESMEIDGQSTDGSNPTAGTNMCGKCHIYPVEAYLVCQSKHGLCGKCIRKALDREDALRCSVCFNAAVEGLIPDHESLSAGMTPGRTRHGSSNTEATSPLKREHSLNKRAVFHTVERYKANGSKLFKLNLSNPGTKCHVATHPKSDQIFISNFLQNQINVFSKDGMYDCSFGRVGTEIGEFNDPWGLTVSEGGDLAIADLGNKRVQFRCLAGSGPWQPPRGLKGDFHVLRGVAFAQQHIFCADFKNVKIVDLVLQTVSPGFTHHLIDSLYDVAVDHDSVYASSQCKGDVYQFNHRGELVRIIRDKNYEHEQFAGITLDGRGNLLVCDQMNSCLKIFDTESEPMTCEDVPLPGKPCSVAVQRGTMNIVVSYCVEEVLGEAVVAMLNDPTEIRSSSQ